MPHDKIISPKVLVSMITGPKLEYGAFTFVKKDSGCDRTRTFSCQGNEAKPWCNDFFVDVSKERVWLGRKAVSTSRLEVEPIIFSDAVFRPAQFNTQAAMLCLVNGPSNGTANVRKKKFQTTSKV